MNKKQIEEKVTPFFYETSSAIKFNHYAHEAMPTPCMSYIYCLYEIACLNCDGFRSPSSCQRS